MPRKTRRRKQIAQLHKQKDQQIPPSISEKSKAIDTPVNPFSDDTQTTNYFVKDLRKSVVIVVIILMFEAALYFAAQYDIFSSIKL